MQKLVELKSISKWHWFSRVMLRVSLLLFCFFQQVTGIRGFLPIVMMLPIVLCVGSLYLSCRCLILNAKLSPKEVQRGWTFQLWFQLLLVALMLSVLSVIHLSPL